MSLLPAHLPFWGRVLPNSELREACGGNAFVVCAGHSYAFKVFLFYFYGDIFLAKRSLFWLSDVPDPFCAVNVTTLEPMLCEISIEKLSLW